MTFDYAHKLDTFVGQTGYSSLDARDREAIRDAAFAHRLTFQEFRQVVENARDLAMWGEAPISDWFAARDKAGRATSKAGVLADLAAYMDRLRRDPKRYDPAQSLKPTARERQPVVNRSTDKTVFGMCPVASPKTVCCNLRTIDAVENCVFGCSYCAVQTFYSEEIVFDDAFAAKLDAIELDPGRPYHIGTGQASDSLAWGNKNGVLDALFAFARKHPNVLLELKTKSDNVRYLTQSDVPDNVVCSWSLNTSTIIENEEHFTASLDRRLVAARRVADRGVGVAFHFHPMVYYDGWREDYTAVAGRLIDTFNPSEVRFLSLGSVTMTKPVIKKIREAGNPTRILQMDFVPDPHGKLTYPDEIKVEMFGAMLDALSHWRECVFMYLCMEKREIWERTFGYAYGDNETFEMEFARQTGKKRRGSHSDLIA